MIGKIYVMIIHHCAYRKCYYPGCTSLLTGTSAFLLIDCINFTRCNSAFAFSTKRESYTMVMRYEITIIEMDPAHFSRANKFYGNLSSLESNDDTHSEIKHVTVTALGKFLVLLELLSPCSFCSKIKF